jgi:hypothetical protein
MQTWLYRLPPAARAVVTGAWVFAVLFGVTQLAALQASSAMFPNAVAARAVMAAIVGVVLGVIEVVLGDQRVRRVYGSTERAITYSRALRTGHLPTDIEPAAWLRWLDVSRQSMRWGGAPMGAVTPSGRDPAVRVAAARGVGVVGSRSIGVG